MKVNLKFKQEISLRLNEKFKPKITPVFSINSSFNLRNNIKNLIYLKQSWKKNE